MANYFVIVNNVTGKDESWETDAAAERLTDPQLAAIGKTRVAVNGPLLATELWNSVTHAKEAMPAGLNAISPPVTKPQAAAILKALLEAPPTGGAPWTQLQRDQCMYALLLGLFKDLKNGTVY